MDVNYRRACGHVDVGKSTPSFDNRPNPITTRAGADYAHHITVSPPSFEITGVPELDVNLGSTCYLSLLGNLAYILYCYDGRLILYSNVLLYTSETAGIDV